MFLLSSQDDPCTLLRLQMKATKAVYHVASKSLTLIMEAMDRDF